MHTVQASLSWSQLCFSYSVFSRRTDRKSRETLQTRQVVKAAQIQIQIQTNTNKFKQPRRKSSTNTSTNTIKYKENSNKTSCKSSIRTGIKAVGGKVWMESFLAFFSFYTLSKIVALLKRIDKEPTKSFQHWIQAEIISSTIPVKNIISNIYIVIQYSIFMLRIGSEPPLINC